MTASGSASAHSSSAFDVPQDAWLGPFSACSTCGDGRNQTLRKPRCRGGGDAVARLRPASSLPARVPRLWYKDGMARVRISTTVDEQLLAAARESRSGTNDAALIDEALDALLARNRAVEIDAAYAAYDRIPLETGDEWGDLASFRVAAGSS